MTSQFSHSQPGSAEVPTGDRAAFGPGTDMTTGPSLLEIRGLSRSFGSIQALDGIDFELRSGEVMALVGENGAGKSTLVKILAGLQRPDSGEIRLAGVLQDTGAALRRAGIAVVQQELSLVPTLSVAENVFLGHPDARSIQSPGRLARDARPFLEQVGLGQLDPTIGTSSLVVAEQQLIEVARLLARDARILILDEPTAALSDVEIARVKQVVRSLVAERRSVIYVTHRLAEVFDLADRVTVFRNGRSQPPVPVTSLTPSDLVERMLGRPLAKLYPPHGRDPGSAVMTLRGLMGPGLVSPVELVTRERRDRGPRRPDRQRCVCAAADRRRCAARHAGRDRGRRDTTSDRVASRSAKSLGVAYCSGDRKVDGLFGIRSVTENLSSPALPRVSVAGFLSPFRERRLARSLADFFQVDRRRLGSPASTLSGGNQQKVALGKWLGIEPRILLVDEPTRGVDVGARAEIYGHIRRLADQGMAVVFASSDIAEVLGLADTIITFYRGREVGRYAVSATDEVSLVRDITHPTQVDDAA